LEKILKHIILPVVFALFLVLPIVNRYTGWPMDIENSENRALAEKPIFDLCDLEPFPVKFDSFFNDHFPLRNYSIAKLSEIKSIHFGISPLPDKVIIGKQGWLFMKVNDYETYMGRDTLSYIEIRRLAREILRRSNYLKALNCKYYYVLVPTKFSVYPEYLPGYFAMNKPHTLTDQIKEVFTKSGIAVIDLREELKKSKSELLNGEDLFLKSDNHWNGMGGYAASYAIINRLRQDFPVIQPPLPLDSFNIIREKSKGGNLATIINLRDKYTEKQVWLRCKSRAVSNGIKKGYTSPPDFSGEFELVKRCNADNKLKLLVIRDSFGDALVPVLSTAFHESVYVFDKWENGLNEDIVNTEKPDIFIQMPIESLADNIWKKL
jgi:alginate O-acetyltransferase complex protein AlgJ